LDTLSPFVLIPPGEQHVEPVDPELRARSNGTTTEAGVSLPCSQSKRLYSIESPDTRPDKPSGRLPLLVHWKAFLAHLAEEAGHCLHQNCANNQQAIKIRVNCLASGGDTATSAP